MMVTGGAKRLGAVIARHFGEAGWHVIIHYRTSATGAEALAAQLPSAQTVRCDLADGDAAVAMVERLAGQLPDWRVLINSASIFEADDVTELNPATYRQVMQINAATPIRMAQSFLANARPKCGPKCGPKYGRRVIHITDQKLANPNPDFFSYTLGKHALDGSIAMLAMGATAPGDKIYGLAPGAILASHDQTPEETERSHVMNLLKRKTDAREVAEGALFLAQGTIANGETLFVDSGQHLLNQARDVIYLAREDGTNG